MTILLMDSFNQHFSKSSLDLLVGILLDETERLGNVAFQKKNIAVVNSFQRRLWNIFLTDCISFGEENSMSDVTSQIHQCHNQSDLFFCSAE